MKESTRKIFHWEKDFGRRMVRIALPIALQNLVAASAHIVDGLMVAGLKDNGASYAAVTQAGRYSFLFQLFLFGAASGTSGGCPFQQFCPLLPLQGAVGLKDR